MSGWTSLRSSGMTSLRRVRAARGGTAVLLTYHRVVDTRVDPQRLAVSTARFAAHISAFAARYELLTAGQVFEHLTDGRKLPRNAIAITIDDGYADALANALPILRAHQAPATIFVCSGLLGGEREFWWDELERLVLLAEKLPDAIEIDVPGAEFRREVPATPEWDGSGLEGWDFTQTVTHPRQQLYLDLIALVEPLSPALRETVLASLREQTGASALVRAHKRALTPDQVVALDASGLVEIGAHTVSHARLGSLSPEAQRTEIVGSKRALETLCGHSVDSFSYPYGTAGAYSAETVEIVQQAGFLGACTTRLGPGIPWGSASLGTNPFEVPRTATSDVPAEQLVALIDKRLGL